MTVLAETRETQEVQRPALHFVYCRHTPDNVPAIAAALEDCDAVLIESIGTDRELLEQNFELLNAITFGDITPHHAQELVRYNTEGENLNEMIDLLLAYELYGTRKMILPIDIAKASPIYARQEESIIREADFWKQVGRGTISLSLAKTMLASIIREKAAINTAREGIVTSQLIAYSERLAAEYGYKKVGVVQGAVHTNSSHEMIARQVPTTRQFVDRDDNVAGQKIQFGPYETAARFKRFFPADTLSDELLTKILVENIMLARLDLPPVDGRHEAEWSDTLTALRSVVIDRMPEDELHGFLHIWERNNRQTAKGRKQRLRNLIQTVIRAYDTNDE